jgi:hypothetical protein
MRIARGVIYSVIILLFLISILANVGAAVGPRAAPGFARVCRLPAVMAWLQAQLPFLPWLQPSGQLAETASGGQASPKVSLSLPAGTSVTSTGGRMVFAQIADGPFGSGGKFDRTSFFLINDSLQNASGTISFYTDAGQPLTLTMDGVTAATFPFTLAKGAQRRFTTSGGGDFKKGWAMMLADQPVTGTSEFEVRDAAGTVYGDVGVTESFLGTKFTIFADSIGGYNTGLALVNPSDSDINHLLLQLYDLSGGLLSQKPLELKPMEHTAQYLTQFFSNVANIQAFEGTMVISSMDDRKFGGITLRLIGDLLTSVPMVMPPPDGSTRDRLYFPQIADGLVGDYRCVSSVLLFNNTTASASGTVEFLGWNSTTKASVPMMVTIGGVKASVFPFLLNPGGARRMMTSGQGSGQVGWARVKMDKPISGAAVYQIISPTGNLSAEVGITSAAISNSFNLIADTIGLFDTAIALANPAENGVPANVYASLLGKSGSSVASTSFSLAAGEHKPLYLTQLFPNYSRISEFEGRIRFDCGNPIIPLTLRSFGEKLTSVPVLRFTHGFAPTGIIEPVQNLAGSKPSLRWRISQPIGDLAINSIQVSAPALGLNPANLRVGDQLGYGVFLLDIDGDQLGGIVNLTVTSLTDGISFMVSADGLLLQGSQIGLLQMTGKIRGNAASGFTIDMTSGNLPPRSTNGGVGVAMDIFFRPDLIVAPATAGTIQVTSVYESPSTKIQEAGVPIRTRVIQPVTFVAPDAVVANLTKIDPVLPGPKTRIRLQATNLGSQPKIYFTPAGGTRFERTPVSADATGCEVEMPDFLGEGVVQIDNGQGIGNSVYFRSVFAPKLDLQALATGNATPLSFTITTGAEQLALAGFTLEMLNTDRTLSGFARGADVGTITTTGGSRTNFTNEVPILVISSAADKLVLDVSGNGSRTLTIQKIQSGLTFTYEFVTPYPSPLVNAVLSTMEIKLTGVPIDIAVGGQTTTWSAEIRSTASGFAGANYFLSVIFP